MPWQTIYELYRRYDRQHLIENASFVVAASGIALVVLDNAYVDSEGGKLALRSLNAALTLVLLALVAWRFAVVREILIQRNVVPAHVALHRMPARRLLQLVLELAVCAVCVPPGLGTDATFRVWEWKFYVDSTRGASACVAPYVVHSGGCYLAYTYPCEPTHCLSTMRPQLSNALLSLYQGRSVGSAVAAAAVHGSARHPQPVRVLEVRITKSLHIGRWLALAHGRCSYRTSYLGALHRVDTMSSLFAVKCFLHAHPLSFLLAAFLGTLLVTAYTLAIIEGPSNPSVAPIWNALWLVVVTMGTIGYGDVTPVTMAGEVLLVIGGMLAGILLVGALVSGLAGYLLYWRAKILTMRLLLPTWNRAPYCLGFWHLTSETSGSSSSYASKSRAAGSATLVCGPSRRPGTATARAVIVRTDRRPRLTRPQFVPVSHILLSLLLLLWLSRRV